MTKLDWLFVTCLVVGLAGLAVAALTSKDPLILLGSVFMFLVISLVYLQQRKVKH